MKSPPNFGGLFVLNSEPAANEGTHAGTTRFTRSENATQSSRTPEHPSSSTETNSRGDSARCRRAHPPRSASQPQESFANRDIASESTPTWQTIRQASDRAWTVRSQASVRPPMSPRRSAVQRRRRRPISQILDEKSTSGRPTAVRFIRQRSQTISTLRTVQLVAWHTTEHCWNSLRSSIRLPAPVGRPP